MPTLDLIFARHSNKFHFCGRLGRHSFRAADVASTSPKYELGKVAFGSMFLKREKSQHFGASSFFKFQVGPAMLGVQSHTVELDES